MSKSKKKCGPGEILRKGFKRKGFERKEFTRKDGTVVPLSYIPQTTVPPTCVPDFGKVGRGRKTLPPPDDLIHLSTYGYSIHKPESVRRAALRAAAQDFDVLLVLRRLNLLRNYQAIPENKEIFTRDVEFMKNMYDPYRKTPRKAPAYEVWENENDLERWQNITNRPKTKKNRNNRRKFKQYKTQRGGNGANTSSSSDDVVENITLSKTKDNLVDLSSYNYSIHKPESVRRRALHAAAQDFSVLPVLRHLTTLRNYQSRPENKEIFTADIEFMNNMYDTNRYNYPKSKQYKTQRGGNDILLQDPITSIDTNTSTTSDDIVENINLPETNIEINTIIDRQKVCDAEGNCGVSNVIYEMHEIDGKQVIYYTLDEKDVDDILQLDKIYLDPNRTRNDVVQNIINNKGLLIGIKIDGKLEGYCQYDPYENMEVEILWFCANKGYRTALYTFMENYFGLSNYTRIILNIDLEKSHSAELINFWYAMGFKTYEALSDKKMHMEKYI
jgi:hypothetical protein